MRRCQEVPPPSSCPGDCRWFALPEWWPPGALVVEEMLVVAERQPLPLPPLFASPPQGVPAPEGRQVRRGGPNTRRGALHTEARPLLPAPGLGLLQCVRACVWAVCPGPPPRHPGTQADSGRPTHTCQPGPISGASSSPRPCRWPHGQILCPPSACPLPFSKYGFKSVMNGTGPKL